MDRIMVPGIPLRAHVGVTSEERRESQDLVVGAVLYLDLASAGATDDLGRTVDYEAVCETVARVVGSRPFHLIEAIAEEVAQAVLAAHGVQEIEVRVEKPDALRRWGAPYAAVEIRRRRDG